MAESLVSNKITEQQKDFVLSNVDDKSAFKSCRLIGSAIKEIGHGELAIFYQLACSKNAEIHKIACTHTLI